MEYGCLSTDDITYFVNSYANTETRQAQNDSFLCELLLNSVTEKFHTKLVGHSKEYDVLGHSSGSLLFKLMISKAIVDTKATSSLHRERLMDLDKQMGRVNSNITEFNHFVKINMEALAARGEAMDDIMVNLFKGYLAAHDPDFVDYMKDQKNKYMLEEVVIEPEKLMALAESKYTIQKDNNEWMVDKEDSKIVALASTVEKQEKELDRLTQIIIQKHGNGNRQNGGGKKRRIRDEDKWKYIPPADGEAPTKTGPNGKTYHWCLYHLMWCIHSTDQCNKNKNFIAREKAPTTKKTTALNKFPNTSKAYSASMTLEELLASIEDEE